MKYRFLFLLPAASLMSIAHADAQPDQRPFAARDFDQVVVSGCDRVRIATGGAFSVTARGDSRVLDAVRVSVRGGVLHLDRARHSCSGNNVPTATITVSMPELRHVELGGTGDVAVDNVNGATFDAELTGTGDLSVGRLHVDKGDLSLSGTGDITVGGVTADTLTLGLSGTGDINARGSAYALTIRDSGTGGVNARDLAARTIDIVSSGTGNVKANASDEARISSSGSGSVTVSGHPQCWVRNRSFAHIICG